MPTCTTALIYVLGSIYTTTDTTCNYAYDDANRLATEATAVTYRNHGVSTCPLMGSSDAM